MSAGVGGVGGADGAGGAGGAGGVLVVGGTAILRPAVDTLLAGGRRVAVLSRSRERLQRLPPTVLGVLADLDEPAALARALRDVPRSQACLAYLPGAGAAAAAAVRTVPAVPWALGVLRAAVAGPLVAVLTSAAAAPPVEASAVPPQLRQRLEQDGAPAGDLRVLVLGWTASRPGVPPRWHTPAEISRAALDCLDGPDCLDCLDGRGPRVLGVLRPWADRPR